MRELLFKISRLKILGSLVGFGITYLPFLIPVKKVMYNKKVFAFFHPAPSFPNHILVIPRKIARTIFQLSAEDFCNVVYMAMQIRSSDSQNFTLLINGGIRQDVMQAHFHLFTGDFSQQKKLDIKKGIAVSKNNVLFWSQVPKNLSVILQENGVTEKCFSMLIQFNNNAEPMIYFI